MANITFVDRDDNVIGAGTRQEALQKGIIHRIVRIFLFNSKGELLIQRRGENISSLPGKWDQSAAGHVDEGEEYLTAAYREMTEEIGVEGVVLKEIGKFYTEEVNGKEIKKRFNVLYSAVFDDGIKFNKEEVSEVRWIAPKNLNDWMEERPEDFTQGFVKCFKRFSNTHPF